MDNAGIALAPPGAAIAHTAREKILAMQDYVQRMPQTPVTPNNVLTGHQLIRTVVLPKGMLAVGAIHKHPHVVAILRGRISVYTENAPDQAIEFVAPCVMVSPAGTKRVVFAHEETEWVNVHATQAQNAEEAERELVCSSFEEYERFLLESPTWHS